MDIDRAKALIEGFLDAYNRMDVDAMMGFFDPDIEFRNVCGGKVDAIAIGLEEFRALAQQSAELFAVRNQAPANFRTDGKSITVDIDYVGTPAVDMPNGMKAGKELRVSGKSEYEFLGDKILKLTDYS